MARLSPSTRELAVAEIVCHLKDTGQITEEEAAHIIAQKACQNWDDLSASGQDFYLRCARGMLGRLSCVEGLPLRDETVWQLLESPDMSIPESQSEYT